MKNLAARDRKHRNGAWKLRLTCLAFPTKWADDAGAELFEAALVLPLLLMLLLGIVAFGRAYDIYQTMTRAAREGTRALVVTGCATCSDAYTSPSASTVETSIVKPVLAAAYLDTSKVSNYTTTYVLLDPNDPVPNICGIRISFKYPYELTLPFTTLNFSTLNLSATVQMQMENQPATCAAGSAVP